MVAIEPNADPISVYDPETCECVLAEWYKQSIQDVIPQGIEPLEAFWLELTDMVSKFQIMKKCHAARRSPATEIKLWQRIAKLATEVIPTAASARVKDLAENQIRAHRAFQDDFTRKKNRNNEVLYIWILEDLWCRALGQGLSVSVNNKMPTGPLIRFFSTCVNPLLSEPLTAHAIVTIRDRMRVRREKHKTAREKLEARRRIKA
jgi:hypothetical protein